MESNISQKDFITTQLVYLLITISFILVLVFICLEPNDEEQIEFLFISYEGCPKCKLLEDVLHIMQSQHPTLYKIKNLKFNTIGDIISDIDEEELARLKMKRIEFPQLLMKTESSRNPLFSFNLGNQNTPNTLKKDVYKKVNHDKLIKKIKDEMMMYNMAQAQNQAGNQTQTSNQAQTNNQLQAVQGQIKQQGGI